MNLSLHRAVGGAAAAPRARLTRLIALLPGVLLAALAFVVVGTGLPRTVLLVAAAIAVVVGLYAIGGRRMDFAQAMEAFAHGDHAVAAPPLLALAERGDVRAQTNLGYLYAYGLGVRKDETLAVRWYRKAAHRGYAPAQYNLAHMYLDGRGCERSEEEAVRWYHQSAGHDFAPALCSLGYAYEKGRTVPRSKETAAGWYYKAGVHFLRDGERAEATAMLRAIERLSSDHPFASELRTELGIKD